MPLKSVQGGMRIIALCISSHEQTQLNWVCYFLTLWVLSISEGNFFPDYLECSWKKPFVLIASVK